MAGTVRLSYDGTDIDLSPRPGYYITQHRHRTVIYALDGTPYVHEWGSKKRWEVPLSNISDTDEANITSWWDNIRLCTFYHDYDAAPAQYSSVYIMNEQQPLQMMFGTTFDTKYEGTLILHEA